jgi:hypothetical protein
MECARNELTAPTTRTYVRAANSIRHYCYGGGRSIAQARLELYMYIHFAYYVYVNCGVTSRRRRRRRRRRFRFTAIMGPDQRLLAAALLFLASRGSPTISRNRKGKVLRSQQLIERSGSPSPSTSVEAHCARAIDD